MLIWLVASAMAQDAVVPNSLQLNGQVFRPAIGSTTTLWTEDTKSGPDGYATGRTFLQYALKPLRVQGPGGTEVLVQDVAELDLAGAFYYKGLRFGAHVPVYAWTSSPVANDQAGLGDVLLDLQGQILNHDKAPLGLAVAGRLILPTASVDAPLGARNTGWELVGIVDKPLGPVTIMANVGTRGVPRARYNDMVWDDQFFLRTGAGWSITERVGLSGEFGAQTNWSSGDNPAGTAAELLGGGWLGLTDELVLRGGTSVGLGRAPGTPVGRILAGVSFQPDAYPDRDFDGVVDRDDWCPTEPEDVDGFEDADGCMDAKTAVVMEITGADGERLNDATVQFKGPETHEITGADSVISMHPGTYTLTVTADGYEPHSEEIVIQQENGRMIVRPLVAKVGSLRVWAVDANGQAVDAMFTVSGGDSWPADGSPIQVVPGEHALVITSQGRDAQAVSLHVDAGQGREYSAVLQGGVSPEVRMTTDRIEIGEQVHFDLNKASIQQESFGLLNQVAAAILAHPEIARVRVEGHTDDQGPTGFNQKLSEQRADAVRTYLQGRGVDPSRLRSVGFGPSRPLQPGETEASRAANRRVEFHLES